MNNPEEEVQQILDDITVEMWSRSKFKSKDGGILADMVHKYSNKFYEIIEREFKDCKITIKEFRIHKYFKDGDNYLSICVKITLSQVSRIEVKFSGNANHLRKDPWQVTIFNYQPERSVYSRMYNITHYIPVHIKDGSECLTEFPFKAIKEHLTKTSKHKVTTDGNIVPGIIQFLKKNIDPELTYHKIGVGPNFNNSDSGAKWFKYAVRIFKLNYELKQEGDHISVTGGGIDIQNDILLADPQCFEKLKQEILNDATASLNGHIVDITQCIKHQQDKLVEINQYLKKIGECKEAAKAAIYGESND